MFVFTIVVGFEWNRCEAEYKWELHNKERKNGTEKKQISACD